MKTLHNLLNNELSPDKMNQFTPNELALYLIELGIVESATDVNMLIIEGIQKALAEDDEFPIKYYSSNEEIKPESVTVNPGVCLTDDFIQNAFDQ